MKAKESVKNYPSKLRESTNYTVKTIKNICKNIGPRAPGGDSEKKAQEFVSKELESCCDTVSIEEFSVHPKAFLSWVSICSYLMIVAAILFFFGLGVVSLAITLVCLSFVVGEFILYKEMLDPLFKKKTSRNVVGIRKPTGEVKRRIIFSGHIDSSQEWRFTHLGGAKLLTSVIVMAVVGFVIGLALPTIAIIKGQGFNPSLSMYGDDKFLKVLSFIFLGFIPLFFTFSFFINNKLTVIGAIDNLTGAIASVAVAKFMQANNIRFEHTEVRVLTTGSEEVGLRGAKAYSKRHLKECQEIETVFCNSDTLKDLDFIAIYDRDLSSTVQNDKRVCALIKQAGATAGIDLPYKPVFFGASDAAAISQAGLFAATLASMDPAPPRYYHTRRDTADILEPKSIEAGLNILLEAAFLYDEQGLKESY
ncbi:MAG: M20/M25/M40 family metallo-hydrolase [Clostridiales bacterium]|nr:M20/M25/M40 family metallo-hydrolase [Clostridiales bacterium]